MSDIKLYNEDCLKVLKEIENESVDCCISDVPYLITPRGSEGTMGGYWKSDLTKSGKIFENNSVKCGDYLPHLYRILKEKNALLYND